MSAGAASTTRSRSPARCGSALPGTIPRPPPAGLIDVVIEPAQAFGTGAHATTRGCLELLVGLARGGEAAGPLLDLGSRLGRARDRRREARLRAGRRRRQRARSPWPRRARTRRPTRVAIDVGRLDLRSDPLPARRRRSSRTCCVRCCSSLAERLERRRRDPDRVRAPARAGRRGRGGIRGDATGCASARASRTATGRRCCWSAGDRVAPRGRPRSAPPRACSAPVGTDTRGRMLFERGGHRQRQATTSSSR